MEKTEKFTNEELVDRIKRGVDVTHNYELLYEQNKPLIRRLVKPFADSSGEDIDDLLQESFFALQTAVEHFEIGGGANFMTYAGFWIKQSAQAYIHKCGLLRIPAHESVKIRQYKRFCNEFERDRGYAPGDADVSGMMNISPVEIDKIKSLAKGMSSLDSPLADTDSLTLGDTLAADGDIEEDTIDGLMDEQRKNELWQLVEEHISQQENAIVKDYYLYGCTMPEMAKKYGVTYQRIAQIKHDALGRLRRGKAKKELQQRFEVLDSSLFSGGFKSYCNRDFTSNVEYIAMRKMELQRGYDSTVDYLNKKYMQDADERLQALNEEYEKELQKLGMN
jgi:RNA polymerase sigma factor (sigma-70 family)